MFTGIVQRNISITGITATKQVCSVSFSGVANWNLAIGDSVLINGICSTVTEINNDECSVEYMPQTLRLTTVQQWKVGQQCNAETSLTLTTPVSGWIVTGHIDTIGTITAQQAVESDVQLIITYPKQFIHLVIRQGAITIEGVNLTVSNVNDNTFSVHIIPHTLEHTTLHSMKPGDDVNLEFDYFAKITAQQLQLIQ